MDTFSTAASLPLTAVALSRNRSIMWFIWRTSNWMRASASMAAWPRRRRAPLQPAQQAAHIGIDAGERRAQFVRHGGQAGAHAGQLFLRAHVAADLGAGQHGMVNQWIGNCCSTSRLSR
jgi:hypothetical protein